MKWKVFLPEDCISRVENKVHELAEGIAAAEVKESGLMGGAAGVACFYAYYADWTGNLRFKGLAEEMVEHALNPPAGHLQGYSFSNGLAGIAWSIQHLYKHELLDIDASEIFKKADPILIEEMLMEIRHGHYDYLHGALGIALYFTAKEEVDHFKEPLGMLVAELAHQAVKENDGSLKWLSVLDREKDLQGYNLSLSHGMASIVIVLSILRRKGINPVLCESLLRGARKYISKQAFVGENKLSTYPSWAIESTEDPGNSRLAWCYGDIGLSLAYMEMGEALNDDAAYRQGEELMMRSGERKDLNDNRVMDAGICHGSAGLALIFNLAFQRIDDGRFSKTAKYWVEECLKMSFHADGIAGYKANYHPQYGGWVKVPGLLEGAAGIGLALLSFLSERDPAWREALLL